MGKSQKRSVNKALVKAQEKTRERQTKRALAKVTPNIDANVERRRPRLVALLFCMFFSSDGRGRYNHLGCFDRIFVDPATKETGQFILVVRTAETREKGVVISFLDPSNNVLAAVIFDEPSSMPTDKPMHLQYSGSIGFTATTEGSYWIDVSYKGESLGGASLIIDFGKPPDVEGKI
jgi:hypothetical protein